MAEAAQLAALPSVAWLEEEVLADHKRLRTMKAENKTLQVDGTRKHCSRTMNLATGEVFHSEQQYLKAAGRHYSVPYRVIERERAALIELFECSHGFGWGQRRGWVGRKRNKPGIAHFEMHPSTWVGVEVAKDTGEDDDASSATASQANGSTGAPRRRLRTMRVVAVDLSHNNLDGRLPPNLHSLSVMTRLDLSGNLLGGPLPDSLTRMERLTHLCLRSNAITGNLPPCIGNLSALVDLDVSMCRMTGKLPSEFKYLDALEALDLSHNAFTGPLANTMCGATALTALRLHGNKLTGALPSRLSDLSSLETLNLSCNAFTGELHALAALPEIRSAQLQHNRFDGRLAAVGDLSSLTLLYVHGNALSGPIPPAIGDCAALRFLNLQDNNLRGHVPREVTRLEALRVFLVAGNSKLKPPYPVELGHLLGRLVDFSGCDPDWPSNDLAPPRAFTPTRYYRRFVLAPHLGLNSLGA